MNNDPATPDSRHLPVMPAEVLELLQPAPGQIVVDATVGGGGHSRLLAERIGSNGRLIGLDRDPTMLAAASARLRGLPVTLVQAEFADLRNVLDNLGVGRVDCLLADLGFCSDQLEDPARGLSFQVEGPLEMRLDPECGQSAADLLRSLPERELARIFWEYGEERFSRRIARVIVDRRKEEPLCTTTQLAELVRRCVPRSKGKRAGIHPATRVFQALRIAVNQELDELDDLLASLPSCLHEGSRAAIISFHSLEDRRVKHTFRDRSTWKLLTRKPIMAQEEEVRYNPRARSAKLRAATLAAASTANDL